VIAPLKVALIESARISSPESGAIPNRAHVRHPAFPLLRVAINPERPNVPHDPCGTELKEKH
jgi:hypothetical protein